MDDPLAGTIIHIVNDCFAHHVIITFLLLLSGVLTVWLFVMDGRKNEWKNRVRNLEKQEPWVNPMDHDDVT